MVGENNKVVIVTGGSSGIGRCTASALKENGCIVYEFSRRSIPMEGVTHLSVDVTDEDAVTAAVQQVIQKETKIDAVINCAGFGISGAVEFTSMEQAKAQFDVNFFGTVTVNKAVLPFLRRQGKGHIVNISSVAAVATFRSRPSTLQAKPPFLLALTLWQTKSSPTASMLPS